MLWLQLAILVLVACVQSGDAKDGSAVTACRPCIQKDGTCVKSEDDCRGELNTNIKCCKCCIAAKGKGDKVLKKNKTPAKTRKGGANEAANKKTKKKYTPKKDGSPKRKLAKGKIQKKENKGDKTPKNRKKQKKNKDDKTPKKRKGTEKGGKGTGKAVKGTKKGGKGIRKGGKGTRKGGKGTRKGGKGTRKKGKGPKKGGKGPKKGGKGPKKRERDPKKGGKGPKKGGKGTGKGGKGIRKGTGKEGKGTRQNGSDDDNNNCDLKCKDGTCIKKNAKCDKINDCGNDDDTDEQGCNFAPKLSCHRCKNWDTAEVGATFDTECVNNGYGGHIDKADSFDPYIGCATKVYKNGDVLRLFESWEINDKQGNCYEGTDDKNGGPEYQYTRCWCSGNNCNTNSCEECTKK